MLPIMSASFILSLTILKHEICLLAKTSIGFILLVADWFFLPDVLYCALADVIEIYCCAYYLSTLNLLYLFKQNLLNIVFYPECFTLSYSFCSTFRTSIWKLLTLIRRSFQPHLWCLINNCYTVGLCKDLARVLV